MTQLSGNQFEDDLTVGMEESDAYSNDAIDMFGISGDDESPIARLKSIILSIDWEISDEILKQLDDELLDLGEIWAGDKIKQVYVQGLSKIGRYIFKEKAGAHPDAIKLLLSFFHNLETIVVSEDSMGAEEKKKLLLSDVRKFDQLKVQIGKSSEAAGTAAVAGSSETQPVAATGESAKTVNNVKELKALKALVLGIDWEITDLELENLGNEVERLQQAFANDRPKLILLQGIGALSAYVNKMRSKSNGKAFTLLRSFCNMLEQIAGNALSASEQKELLLAEVSKFNQFKAEIAGESPSAPVPAVEETSPAAMSAPEAESTTEEVVSPDEDDVSKDVSSRLSSVFGEGDSEGSEEYTDADKARALEGVNVETEADDDSDEEALPYEEGGVAPALAEIDEDSSFSVEKLASDLSVAPPTAAREAIVGEDIELDDDIPPVVDVDDVEEHESALMGVDVETEADDDSDEESLPMSDGTLAPALSEAEFEGGFDADSMASEFDGDASDAIESRLGDFFDDEVTSSAESWDIEKEEDIIEEAEEPPGDEEGLIAALSETIDEKEDGAFEADESLTAALSQFDDESEEELSGLDEEEIETEEGVVAALSDYAGADEAEPAIDVSDEPLEDEESLVAALSDSAGADETEPALDLSEEPLEDEESLVAALSDYAGADETEPAIDVSEELLEDEESLVAALSDSASADETESAIDLSEEPLEAEESFVAALSEFDDGAEGEIESVEETIASEGKKEAEEYEADQELEVFEKETPVLETTDDFATKDEIELHEEVEETVESGLAFLDEEPEAPISHGYDAEEVPPVVEKTFDEEIAFEVESDDELGEDDEIEFTVPGTEIVEPLTQADDMVAEKEESESIKFDLPGEGNEEVVSFMSDEEKGSDEVIFEAVDDDVALDLLPGEEFDDSGIGIAEEKKRTVPVSGTGKYGSLSMLATQLDKDVVGEEIQDIFVELKKLRDIEGNSYTDKTFLQLLFSVCQYLEKNPNSDEGISLIRDIVSGLEMSDKGDVSSEKVQESLFSSTSRFLVLQRKEMDSLLSGFAREPDSQAASYVQKELADIRKLFVEEIGNLRKELSGR